MDVDLPTNVAKMEKCSIYRLFWITLCVCSSQITTSAKVDKTCIKLLDCPSLLNLLKANPNDNETVQYLRTSHCGFEGRSPKVWCENSALTCQTPDSKNGTCRAIKDCDHVLKLLRTSDLNDPVVRKYVQEFRCERVGDNRDAVEVCCPNEKEETILKEPQKVSLLPNPKNGECGTDNNLNRIYGGQETRLDEFPWMAILQYKRGNTIIPGCGGSLINKKYVITAAHCIDEKILKAKKFDALENIILGEYDTRNETDCFYYSSFQECADPVKIVSVETTTIHPLWNISTLQNDVGLVRLAETVTFTEFVKPVCLPNMDYQVNLMEQMVICGWGRTETERRSPVKLKVYIPLLDRNNCSHLGKPLTDKQMCIGGIQGKDSCPGDSGGPVMQTKAIGRNSVLFLVGLVSYGHRICGISPAVYTYVPKYVDWIFENIKA